MGIKLKDELVDEWDELIEQKGGRAYVADGAGCSQATISRLMTGGEISKKIFTRLVGELYRKKADWRDCGVEPARTSRVESLFPTSISTEPIPFGIPSTLKNNFFTGRQNTIEHLHKQFMQRNAAPMLKVQALTGLGGVGKTQIAVEYAFRYFFNEKPSYEYVFWVNADLATLISSFAAIASQLAISAVEDNEQNQIKDAQRWLTKNGGWLLIFDNVDEPTLVKPFIPANPGGKVLITSRSSILDMLNVVNTVELPSLSVEDAIDFLFRRTGYERTETNEALARELNLELGSLPLALEQAGGHWFRQVGKDAEPPS